MTAADRPSVTPRVGDTITTAEQLDALPSLTIVIDANEEVQQRHGHLATEDGDYSAWLGVMPPTCKPSPKVALPATVLYVPGEQPRPSVTDDARGEANRRYPDRDDYRTSLGSDPEREQKRHAFIAGVLWAAGRAETTTATVSPTLAEISLRLALEMDCERVYDDNANAYYCNEHDVGWLSDTNQCARAERLADAVLALLADQPTEAEAGARALVHAAGDHFHAMVAAGAGNPSEVSTWLRERAARLRGGERDE